MPNILPGAVWQPVDVGNRAPRRKGRGLVGHVAVSTSKNLTPGPLAARSADWHFYLPKSGPAIQYIDMDVQCWASGAGNASLVAYESEGGMGTAAQVNAEPWTDNQLNWAARILRHLHDTEGVPLQVMNDSLPGSRGFGTHRLGIDPWRVAGGELWSSSRGKLCPGDAKHAQRSEIVNRAENGATGGLVMDAEVAKEFAELRRLGAMSVGVKIGAVAPGEKTPGEQVEGRLNTLEQNQIDIAARLDKILGILESGGAGSVDVRAVADQLTVVPKQ